AGDRREHSLGEHEAEKRIVGQFENDQPGEGWTLAKRRQRRTEELPQIVIGVLVRLVRPSQVRQNAPGDLPPQFANAALNMRADRRWDDFKLERELADREPLRSSRVPQLDGRVDDFRASHSGPLAGLALCRLLKKLAPRRPR